MAQIGITNYNIVYFFVWFFLIFGLNAIWKSLRMPKTILGCFKDNEFHFKRVVGGTQH